MRAYLSSLTVAPGGSFGVHGSAGEARARVVELLHSDPDPRGPGVVEHACDWGTGHLSVPAARDTVGSFAEADDAFVVGHDFTVSAWVWPTDLRSPMTLAHWSTGAGDCALVIDAEGVHLRLGQVTHTLEVEVRERVWLFVGVVAGRARALRGEGATLFGAPWGRTGGPLMRDLGALTVSPSSPQLRVGSGAERVGAIDGRVAGLRVHDVALDVVELMNVMNGFGPAAAAEWDFGDLVTSDVVAPAGTRGSGLRLFQAPSLSTAVPPPVESTGRHLAGSGSVHFHRDDLEDVQWPLALEIDVPGTARPGLYCVRLESGDGSYDAPFIVSGAAPVTLLVPTLTWQAYANLGRDSAQWPGLSHYAFHSDGSPVIITTTRRPSQTFAPGARLEVGGGNGFATGDNASHLLMADLYAWHWLRNEYPDQCGVIDDRELHLRGAAALSAVDVLVLSAHPEYWTRAMLDALEQFLDDGGSVIYLGGNGLYWVTSLDADRPHLMEVRRWGGSQTCSVDEADRRHQFEDCLGGLWEESGRPPNRTVGVGFAGFGNGPSLEFVRTQDSYEPDIDWLFDGVPGDTFGAGGLNGGAGNEFDAFDPARPPPGRSVIVATARPDTPDHFGTFERHGVRAPAAEVRCDVVLTETPGGGLVLSISSITASGCLSSDGSDGLRRVVGNAINRCLG